MKHYWFKGHHEEFSTFDLTAKGFEVRKENMKRRREEFEARKAMEE